MGEVMKKPRKQTRVAEWRQAARVEANLRREFHDRAMDAEAKLSLHQHRLKWISEKHEEKAREYHFANGFRAGLQCALLALEGRDILGHSIDPQKAK